MSKRLSKEEIKEIIELNNIGMFSEDIALKFNVSNVAIRYQLKKAGLRPNKVIPDFSEDQVTLVTKMYKDRFSCKEIADAVGTTPARIYTLFDKLGFDSSANFFKKEEESELRRLYEDCGKSTEEIAKIYGCYRQAVDVAFKRFGISARNHAQRKQLISYVNREAFTNWHNEADLFFYGLLLSDGCLHGNSISLSLQYSDKHIIESFKEYMQSTNNVRRSDRSNGSCIASFSFMDSVVAGNLLKVGFSERKSANENLPTFDLSNPDISRHFWRGYVCGDGSVRSYKYGSSGKLMPKLHICGSVEVCQGFSDFCKVVLNKDHGLSIRKYNDKREDRTSDLHYFAITGDRAKRISLFMFEDCKLYINRKMQDVLKFKEYNPRWTRGE